MKKMLLVVIGVIISLSLFSAPEAKTTNENIGTAIASVLNQAKSNILEAPKAQFGLYRAEPVPGEAARKNTGPIIVLIVVIIGLVGAGVFFFMKKKAAGKDPDEIDETDFDDVELDDDDL